MVKSALFRNAPGQSLPNTDISKGGRVAAVNVSAALRCSATGGRRGAEKTIVPVDPARLITTS